MARMLETLNQNPAACPAAPRPSLPQEKGLESSPVLEDNFGGEEEIPFIEVGPVRGAFEASPGVLAAGKLLQRPRPAPSTQAVPPVADEGPAEPVKAAVLPRSFAPSPLARNPLAPLTGPMSFRPVGDRSLKNRPAFAPELIAYHAAGQPASAPYRDLLGSLLSNDRGRKCRQVLFFTAGRAEACTTTVLLNLAITAALQGREVLVIDANLRRPGIAARLGLGDIPGLREVLAGHFGVEEVVRPTGLPGLKALTSGPLAGPARLTITPEGVRHLLEECRQTHELVFVDGSRWDGRPDVTSFGAAADAVYLVVSAAEVDTPAIQGLTQLIPEQGGWLAGSILVGG